MKRLDFIFLTIIAVTSFYFGYKLILSDHTSHALINRHPLSDFSKYQAQSHPDAEDIYLLAQKWQWSTEITLYEGRVYSLHVASSDIQHGFHLERAATGQKIDILIQPGFEYTVKLENLKEGEYAIGCTEYCGIEHNKMRGKLIVLK